jgi:hypothetical protein
MTQLLSLQAIEQPAAQVAERLRHYEPGVTPPEEVQDAVQTVLALSTLTLVAWDAVQRLIQRGAEGGRARALVGKVSATVQAWLGNVRTVVGWIPQWHQAGGAPLAGLDLLTDLERKLDETHSQAQRLLAFLNAPPPSLAPEILGRIEATGAAGDQAEYLDAETFLAHRRASQGP